MSGFFNTPIEYLKGVGPQRAVLLNKELNIFTYGDLIQHYPFRYEDRTRFFTIQEIHNEMPYVQLKGKITSKELIGAGPKRRMVCYLQDETGKIELVWFQGVSWVLNKIKPNVTYLVYGKPAVFGNKFNIAHPEMELLTDKTILSGYLQPVYHTSEKLKLRFIDSKTISKFQGQLLLLAIPYIHETLPEYLIHKFRLISKAEALTHIHFPQDAERQFA